MQEDKCTNEQLLEPVEKIKEVCTFRTYKEIVKEYKIKEKAKQDFLKIQAKITITKLHKWRKENDMDFKDDYFFEDL